MFRLSQFMREIVRSLGVDEDILRGAMLFPLLQADAIDSGRAGALFGEGALGP